MTSPRQGTPEKKLADLLEELSFEIMELSAEVEDTREMVAERALFFRHNLNRIAHMAGLDDLPECKVERKVRRA